MDRLSPKKTEITKLLKDYCSGNDEAMNDLVPFVLEKLRRIARGYLKKERQNHTLQTTDLVQEAFLKLIDQRSVNWQNRAHFFAICAIFMRRILINYAKKRNRDKREGDFEKLSLEEALHIRAPEREVNLIELDEALNRLIELDERQVKIVEFRFFGGLTFEEIAEVLNISVATVKREWTMAKAWLYAELDQ